MQQEKQPWQWNPALRQEKASVPAAPARAVRRRLRTHRAVVLPGGASGKVQRAACAREGETQAPMVYKPANDFMTGLQERVGSLPKLLGSYCNSGNRSFGFLIPFSDDLGQKFSLQYKESPGHLLSLPLYQLQSDCISQGYPMKFVPCTPDSVTGKNRPCLIPALRVSFVTSNGKLFLQSPTYPSSAQPHFQLS